MSVSGSNQHYFEQVTFQRLMNAYQKCLLRNSKKLPWEQLKPFLLLKLEIATRTAGNLDGAELSSLKCELRKFVTLALQSQVSLGRGQDVQLAQTFVTNVLEQEPLEMRDIKLVIPLAGEKLGTAIKTGNLAQMCGLLGGIVGAVLGDDEVFEN